MPMRSQVSFEMTTIFVLIFIAFVGFLVIVKDIVSDIRDEEDYETMRNFAESIKNEVNLASQVQDNYLRSFNIPLKLNGRDYVAYIDGDILDIILYDHGFQIKNYTTTLPVIVKGGFVEDKDADFLDHCITKSKSDGIRIARNQVALELRDINGGTRTDNTIARGNYFWAYARVSCVEDIRGVQFTLRFDSTKLEYVSHEVIDSTGLDDNPLFLEMAGLNPEGLDFRGAVFAPPHTAIDYWDPLNGVVESPANCEGRTGGMNLKPYPLYMDTGQKTSECEGTDMARITVGFVAKDCGTGTGNVARIKFQVKTGAPSGLTTIQFDPDFSPAEYSLVIPDLNQPTKPRLDSDVVVYDCVTLSPDLEALPDTRVNLPLLIT